MKILLAPAETKNEGGTFPPFKKENFFLEEKFQNREEVFEKYENYISSLTLEELSSWFGIKKLDDVKKYSTSLKDKPTMKAIERYNGVAFDALDYKNLNDKEKAYIDENVILFSNLFGPIKSSDLIPDYKYKQGSKLPNISVEKFYNDNFSFIMDEYLAGEDIIDLRAGFYEKFYKLKQPYVTMKFIKDGKVVSHWAKAYRGIILNQLAKNSIKTIDELMNLEIENLKVEEIKETKIKKEIVYSITN